MIIFLIVLETFFSKNKVVGHYLYNNSYRYPAVIPNLLNGINHNKRKQTLFERNEIKHRISVISLENCLSKLQLYCSFPFKQCIEKLRGKYD